MTRAPYVKKTPPRTASPILRDIFNLAMSRGIRVQDLANAVGIHQQRVSEHRIGKVEPGVMKAEEYAAALGCRLVLEPLENSKSRIDNGI